VRHHHLSVEDKERLQAKLARSLQLGISGLAGLYCYFLLLCHDWMEEQGLIESEWREAETGRKRKYYRLLRDGRKALNALEVA